MSYDSDPWTLNGLKTYVEPLKVEDLYPNQPELNPDLVELTRLSEAIRIAKLKPPRIQQYGLPGR